MGIKVEDLYVNYGNKQIIKGMSLKIEDGEIVTIIGPNGSGKSTFIKSISRCLKPLKGKIYLDGDDINSLNTKKVAQKLAILPQVKNVSSDITVEQLVSYGRYPHLRFRKNLRKEDIKIINWAIEKTGLKLLKNRCITTLSGGERQRAWIAMCLAQEPKILILDEPTIFLDISYQIEILQLVKELNKTLNLTVIMVLHDLNQAARYSDKIFVIKDGILYKTGSPREIIEKKLLNKVFRIEANIYEDRENKCPYLIPKKTK